MIFHHVFIRVLACMAFVLATYNPSGYSYWDWVAEGATTAKAAVGIMILIVYVFLFWVVLASLGGIGTIGGGVAAALTGRQIYLVAAPETAVGMVLQVIALCCFAMFLGIGLSWPALMTRLSGQEHKRYLTYANKKKRV